MYIAIEGVIGVGKTTLARLLQPKLKADLFLEVFEENPFLSDFYADRRGYAFQTQIFFLLSRYYQQKNIIPSSAEPGKILISDYTFEKDALFAEINLEGDELEMYYQVHKALSEKTKAPDLIVLLWADTEVLMDRIEMRDRTYERNMDRAYIESLSNAYENHFGATGRDGVRALRVDTNQLNYVSNARDLDWVETLIRKELKLAPYQTEFQV